jgi:intein/homing endonuclease
MPQNAQSLNPAYLAGLFDGEGWVSISSNKRKEWGNLRIWINIGIANKNKEILKMIAEEYGGGVYKKSRIKKQHSIA